MSAQAVPATPKSRKKLIAGVVIVIVAIILLLPPIVAGAFMVPVSTVTFGETTGSLSSTTAQVSVQTMTAYQYYFTVRTGGMVRTTDNDVSSSRGTANITMDLKLTNPSSQTIDLGNTTINGAIGTRTHALYLSIDQGVRAPGSYTLNAYITANVAPVVGLKVTLTTTVTATFTIS